MTAQLPREEREVFALIGVTLLVVQVTERNLGYCINLVFRSGPVITLDSIDALKRDARRKTLGQLIRCFRKAIAVPQTFDEELQSFLDNRNRFVHHVLQEAELDMARPDGMRKLRTFLLRFCDQMESMNLTFLGFLRAFAANLGMTSIADGGWWGELLRKFGKMPDWNLVIERAADASEETEVTSP